MKPIFSCFERWKVYLINSYVSSLSLLFGREEKGSGWDRKKDANFLIRWYRKIKKSPQQFQIFRSTRVAMLHMVAMGSTCNSWIFSSIHALSLPRNTLLAEAAKGRHGLRGDNGSKGQQVTNSRMGGPEPSQCMWSYWKNHMATCRCCSILIFHVALFDPISKVKISRPTSLGSSQLRAQQKVSPNFWASRAFRIRAFRPDDGLHQMVIPGHQRCGYLNSYEVTWQVLGKMPCYAPAYLGNEQVVRRLDHPTYSQVASSNLD